MNRTVTANRRIGSNIQISLPEKQILEGPFGHGEVVNCQGVYRIGLHIGRKWAGMSSSMTSGRTAVKRTS